MVVVKFGAALRPYRRRALARGRFSTEIFLSFCRIPSHVNQCQRCIQMNLRQLLEVQCSIDLLYVHLSQFFSIYWSSNRIWTLCVRVCATTSSPSDSRASPKSAPCTLPPPSPPAPSPSFPLRPRHRYPHCYHRRWTLFSSPPCAAVHLSHHFLWHPAIRLSKFVVSPPHRHLHSRDARSPLSPSLVMLPQNYAQGLVGQQGHPQQPLAPQVQVDHHQPNVSGVPPLDPRAWQQMHSQFQSHPPHLRQPGMDMGGGQSSNVSASSPCTTPHAFASPFLSPSSLTAAQYSSSCPTCCRYTPFIP